MRATASAGRWREAISLLEPTYAAPVAAAAHPTSNPSSATTTPPCDATSKEEPGILLLSPAVSLAARAAIAACGREGEWERGLTVLDGALAHASTVGGAAC